MVKLSRINGAEVTVNAELIETIEATPDTIVSLTTGKRLMVVESVDQVIEKVMAYRRALTPSLCSGGESGGKTWLPMQKPISLRSEI
jgi:flagellar protein FlbD